MKKIIEYQSDDRTPSHEEIEEAVKIAGLEQSIVKLNWHFPYSGNYSILIYPGDTPEEIENKIPRTYGV